MTPETLSDKVETIVSKAEQALGKQVTKTQAALFDQMSLLLNKLELNSEGLIIQNQANRKALAQAETYFNKGMNQSGYYEALNAIPNTIGEITSANAAYFTTVLDSFSPDVQFIKSLQKQTITQAENLLANEGIELTLKQPISNILNQNVNTSAAYNDLVKQLRTFITGSPEVDGALARYSKQIVTDTLFNYNRAYQEAISASSGLVWTKYVGGRMDTTRPFCVARVGKYFHKTEVEKWASQDWAGKRAGTTRSTIFIYAGGYNCAHTIVYVHPDTVPDSVKDRVKKD